MQPEFAVTIPANTLATAPVTQEMKLTAGVVQRVHILFPPGCVCLVKVRIYEGGHQFLPWNPEGDIATDGEVWRADDEYYELHEPYILKAVCYNLDDTYDHEIRIRIGLLRTEDVEKQSGIMIALKKFLQLVGIRV